MPGQRGKMSEILLTFSAVARKIGVTRKTLYRWQSSGKFNVNPHGNFDPPRWHIDDINALLKPASVNETDNPVTVHTAIGD